MKWKITLSVLILGSIFATTAEAHFRSMKPEPDTIVICRSVPVVFRAGQLGREIVSETVKCEAFEGTVIKVKDGETHIHIEDIKKK